jgi:Domain of unknown function (DUF4136)
MKRVIWAVTLSAAALLIPAQAFAQKVNVDFDPAAQFSSYKTYGWAQGTPSPNPLGEERIHAAVEERMAAKGFTKSDNPQVMIATHVVTKEEKEIISTGYGYGYGYYRYGGGMSTATVNTYIQGTLVLDMYDAAAKKLAWRGTATDTVSDKTDKNTKKVNSALDKMMKQYPPPPPKNKP